MEENIRTKLIIIRRHNCNCFIDIYNFKRENTHDHAVTLFGKKIMEEIFDYSIQSKWFMKPKKKNHNCCFLLKIFDDSKTCGYSYYDIHKNCTENVKWSTYPDVQIGHLICELLNMTEDLFTESVYKYYLDILLFFNKSTSEFRSIARSLAELRSDQISKLGKKCIYTMYFFHQLFVHVNCKPNEKLTYSGKDLSASLLEEYNLVAHHNMTNKDKKVYKPRHESSYFTRQELYMIYIMMDKICELRELLTIDKALLQKKKINMA